MEGKEQTEATASQFNFEDGRRMQFGNVGFHHTISHSGRQYCENTYRCFTAIVSLNTINTMLFYWTQLVCERQKLKF